MKEQWRDVVGYSGYYEVSDMGRVRSVDRVITSIGRSSQTLKGRLLKTFVMGTYGHLSVSLSKQGKVRRRYVHQLVAEAFIGPRPKGHQVRHGPKGVLNNCLSNLSYGTRSEDGLDKRRDGTHGGKAVRRSDGVEFINLSEAAEETGCGISGISNTCNGHRRSCGGYGWEFVNEEDRVVRVQKPKFKNSSKEARGTRVKRSDGVIFDSLRQAANASKCNSGDICSVCRGKRKSAGGFTWSYLEEITKDDPGEEWRIIAGYEGFYEVSNLGRVRSVDRVVVTKNDRVMKLKGQILQLSTGHPDNPLQVGLTKDGVACTYTVYQLVAAAFLGPCPRGQQVRHGSNGRLDNSVSNLSYGTVRENSLDKRRDGTHGGRAVRCTSTGVEFINLTVAAEETGCNASSIGRVCKGKQKTANGLKFEYID